MSKPLLFLLGFIGLIFLVIAGIYFFEPAHNRPHFFPGYTPGLVKHHYKHGIVALVIAFVAFAAVWFESGEKKSNNSVQEKVD